jgi:hypothetical protein
MKAAKLRIHVGNAGSGNAINPIVIRLERSVGRSENDKLSSAI